MIIDFSINNIGMSAKDRLKKYLTFKQIKDSEFTRSIGASPGYIQAMSKGFGRHYEKLVREKYPDLNMAWLLTGEGDMLNEVKSQQTDINIIPLLPVSAQGGSLNDFVLSVKNEDCEKIISPIRGADFAITVSGESMAPEYPSGSKVLIKKIDEKAFIEWGRCYVLDTCNGTVIKKLAAPVENDPKFGKNYVTCISVNPNPLYSPFRVPLCDIYGIYRVMMSLSEK